MANRGKNDVLDPTSSSENSKAIKKKAAKAIGKAVKAIGKAIAKIGKAIAEALIELGPIGWIILIVLILIIIVAVMIVSYNMMPGMMKQKLSEFFSIDFDGWFSVGAVNDLKEYTDIVNVANYIEEMGYNLIGDGFVTPVLRKNGDTLTKDEILNNNPKYQYKQGESEDDQKNGISHFYDENGNIISGLKYYDSIGRIIDNDTGKPVSNSMEYVDEFGIKRKTTKRKDSTNDDRGEIAGVEDSTLKNYRLLRSYLLSNYRIYNLKNADQTLFNDIGNAYRDEWCGGNNDAWAKGLIKLYNATGGIATQHFWWFTSIGDYPVLKQDRLSIKKGICNNPIDYSIEGWAPRYGLSLDFLLSLHLGTNAPDLVNAMLQNFDTEIQVYLDESGKAKVDSRYVDPNSSNAVDPSRGDSLDHIQEYLDKAGFKIRAKTINDTYFLSWVNNWALNNKACQALLKDDRLTLKSPANCLGEVSAYALEEVTYYPSGNPLNFYSWLDESKDNQGESEMNDGNLDTGRLIGIRAYKDGITAYKPQYSKDDNGMFLKENEVNTDTFMMAMYTDRSGSKENATLYQASLKDDFRYFAGKAPSHGGSVSNETFQQNPTETKTDYGDIYVLESLGGADYLKYKYKLREDVIESHWYNVPNTGIEGDNQEVEYTWMTYKYTLTCDEKRTVIMSNGDEHEGYWINMAGDRVDVDPTIYENVVICEFIVREKTNEELVACGKLTKNEAGEYIPVEPKDQRCSENEDRNACCSNCAKYVRSVVDALADVSDQDFSAYVPYIARVVGSWFRDTYFIVPESPDVAINEYGFEGIYSTDVQKKIKKSYEAIAAEGKDSEGNEKNEEKERGLMQLTNHPEFDYFNAFGTNTEFVKVDEEYLADSGEYWTKYKTTNGAYQLYFLNPDGTTSDITMEQYLKDNGYNSKEEAEKDGWAFVKKAETQSVDTTKHHTIFDDDDEVIGKILWSVYKFDSNGSATNWEKVLRADSNESVKHLYNIIYGRDSDGDENSGIFYQLSKTNNVTQQEDAQRAETNPLIKYLFKYRKFYIYDGGNDTAVQIEHDKQRVLYGYNSYCEKEYDISGQYYKDKVIANKNDIKGIEFGNENEDGNFYHYKGLLGKDGMLKEYYSSDPNSPNFYDTEPYIKKYNDMHWFSFKAKDSDTDWMIAVMELLDKYGRSALRQTYSWKTDPRNIESKEDLASQWLDWQLDMFYMKKYGVDLNDYYNTDEDLLKITYDPRDPDLINTVEITKSSLSVFSILENTGTLDADYAYRDFKELIVELDYFDKEDLSKKAQKVFTWVLPEVDSAGWPNRPWDKQEVDYGTLIQSSETYGALGFSGGNKKSSGTIDETKIFWIGDSWIVGLSNYLINNKEGFLESNFSGHTGKNADSVSVDDNGNIDGKTASNASAFVINFGLNNPTLYGETQNLIEKIHEKHENIPIYVLKTSHVASSYNGSSYAADLTNQKIDDYNIKMRGYCQGKDYVFFVDEATKTINPSNGNLLDGYEDGSKYHLNSDGYDKWYNDIISSIGGNSSSEEAETSAFKLKTGDGDYDKLIIANDVEYKQFNQGGKYKSIKMNDNTSDETKISNRSGDKILGGDGSGIYAATSLASGYISDIDPEKTCKWMHTNIGETAYGDSSENDDTTLERRKEAIQKFLDGNGISGSWMSSTEDDNSDVISYLRGAFSSNKPVIISIKNGSGIWETSDQHFVCFVGISEDGEIYTTDSKGSEDRIYYKGGAGLDNKENACQILQNNLKIESIFIPDSAPTSAKKSVATANGYFFGGYEEGQKVVSPVTGKILEIGTHERLNIYTGKMEQVEYIVIQVMDNGTKEKPDNKTKSNYFAERLEYLKKNNKAKYEEYEKKYKEYTDNLESEEKMKTYNDFPDALDLFYNEYEGVCSGYTVMIDGFDVDLKSDSDGVYEKNEVIAMYNSAEMEDRQEKERAKEGAPYFINIGQSEEFPGDNYQCDPENLIEGYYIKEGKTLGKTITPNSAFNSDKSDDDSKETPEESSEGNSGSKSVLEMTDKLTYNYTDFEDVPGDYMRILLKDTDYAVVEDVESFFNIKEFDISSDSNASGRIYPGGDVETKVWNALMKAGYTPIAAAGVMGNIYGESQFNPGIEEGGSKIGYGLCQWSYGRRTQLESFAAKRGVPASDADLQIEFLLAELTEGGGADGCASYQFAGFEKYKQQWLHADNVEDATTAFCAGFERPGEPRNQVRIDAAEGYYQTYGKGNVKTTTDENKSSDEGEK